MTLIASTSPANSSSKPSALRAVTLAPAAWALRPPRAPPARASRLRVRRCVHTTLLAPSSALPVASAGASLQSTAVRVRSAAPAHPRRAAPESARSVAGHWGRSPRPPTARAGRAGVQGWRSVAFQLRGPALAHSLWRWRAQVELAERCTQIQACASHHDRSAAFAERIVDLRVCQLGIWPALKLASIGKNDTRRCSSSFARPLGDACKRLDAPVDL